MVVRFVLLALPLKPPPAGLGLIDKPGFAWNRRWPVTEEVCGETLGGLNLECLGDTDTTENSAVRMNREIPDGVVARGNIAEVIREVSQRTELFGPLAKSTTSS